MKRYSQNIVRLINSFTVPLSSRKKYTFEGKFYPIALRGQGQRGLYKKKMGVHVRVLNLVDTSENSQDLPDCSKKHIRREGQCFVLKQD